MGRGMTVGTRTRPARRSTTSRRRELRSSLTAAAAPLLATYEMTQGGIAQRHFYEQALAAGLSEWAGDSWPCEIDALDGTGAEFHDGSHCAIWRAKDGTIVYASLHGGWFQVQSASKDLGAAYAACLSFRDTYPASYLVHEEDDTVAITFWSMGPFGPQSRLRRIDASPWEPIAVNYTAEIRERLGQVMAWEDGPGADGQLMLWQGPPGTGKTWALRALASEWAPWAEFHYITDPDSFFVDNPSYMIDVLLADSYDVIDGPTGDVYDEQPAEGKWRVLILEDTGELLSVNAKEKYGQGLSRLLNVVDGMIGQGLRVLCLVTTNDELGELTPAVKRPGRCASQLVFGSFEPAEASAWLGETVDEAMTVAEMYARRGEAAEPLPERDSDFTPEPEDARDLMAAAAPSDDVRDLITAVASNHQEEAVGYGQTAWRDSDRTVLYVAGDWTDVDPIAADFLAIDGVDAFEYEMEGAPDGWCGAEILHGGNPFRCDDAAALADVLALATEPLVLDPEPTPLTTLAAAQTMIACSPLTQLLAAHNRTVDSARELLTGGRHG